jgi:co-chaperonin GroES (HSP10)
MTLRPLKDMVIVEQIAKETVTSSGIVLTSVDRDVQTEGLVLSVGPDVEYVKKGDRLIVDWSKSAKAGNYWFVKEQFIVAVLED